MPELTQLHVDGVFYNLHDAEARASIRLLQEDQQEIKKLIESADSEIIEMLDEVN